MADLAAISRETLTPAQRPPPTLAEALAKYSPLEQLQIIAEDGEKELARRYLLDFTQYTAPWYRAEWWHRQVCAELEQFFAQVQRKESPRLMIVAPPQSGKSQLVSCHFPAWALGRDPDLNFITTSYDSDRAEFNSRRVQELIESEAYRRLYPDIQLNMHRADAWNLKGHERFMYRAAGIMGGLTGLGAHIMILDDLIKDWLDANSFTILERVWAEVGAAVKSRLSEGGGILHITTRWNEQDPAGKLLSAANLGGFQWRYLWYPALSIEKHAHREEIGDFRELDEALVPGRFSTEYLRKIRDDYHASKQNVIWLTAYQGIPQKTVGSAYFNSEEDSPPDAALTWYEAQLKEPERCKLTEAGVFGPDEGGNWRIYERPIEGFCYGAGVDVSEGIDRGDGVTDEHVIRIWRRDIIDAVIEMLGGHVPKVTIGKPHQRCLVASYRSRVGLPTLAVELNRALRLYNQPYVSVERNDPGIGLIDLYLDMVYPKRLILRERSEATLQDQQGMKLGVRVTSANKHPMLSRLKKDLREHYYTNQDREFFEQARHFININGELRGETRWHDDIVMAEAHCCYCDHEAPLDWPGNLRRPKPVEEPEPAALFGKVGY